MKSILTAITMLIAMALNAQSAPAEQPKPFTQEELYNTIIALDKAVFDAYNNCDIEVFKSFFSDDVEFYHDKGGVALGIINLAESLRKNLCSTPGQKVRREAVTATLKVYPMHNYGAILTGYHIFFQVTNDIKKFTGKAQFTHLWQFKDGNWKITRVLSYDHQPAGE
jgi:hypothetical protein